MQQIFMCVHTCTYTCVRVFPEVISKAATKLFQECTGFKSCLWGKGGGGTGGREEYVHVL